MKKASGGLPSIKIQIKRQQALSSPVPRYQTQFYNAFCGFRSVFTMKSPAIHFRACLCRRVRIIRGILWGSGQGKACLLAVSPQKRAEGVSAVRGTEVMVNRNDRDGRA